MDNITINTNDMQKLSSAMLHVEKATGKSMYGINEQAMHFALQSAAKATPPGTRSSYQLAKKHAFRPLVSLKNVGYMAYLLPDGKRYRINYRKGRTYIYQAENGKIFSTPSPIRNKGVTRIKPAKRLTKGIKAWDKKQNKWEYIPYDGTKRDESDKRFRIPGAGGAKRGWLNAMSSKGHVSKSSGRLHIITGKHTLTEDYISVTDKVEYAYKIAPRSVEIGIQKAKGRLIGTYKKKLEKIGTDFNQFK
jgi:hypothetical protein